MILFQYWVFPELLHHKEFLWSRQIVSIISTFIHMWEANLFPEHHNRWSRGCTKEQWAYFCNNLGKFLHLRFWLNLFCIPDWNIFIEGFWIFCYFFGIKAYHSKWSFSSWKRSIYLGIFLFELFCSFSFQDL